MRTRVLERQRRRARELLPGHDAVARPQHRRRSRPAASRASRTSPSIDKGQSVDLKVNSDDAATVPGRDLPHGLLRRRRRAALLDHSGRRRARAAEPASPTPTPASLDCSNWSVSATLTTTTAWPSGVYMLRLVREDTGTDNQILLVVRDDARPSQLLYGVAVHDLPGLQQLRRQVALRLQLDRRHDRLRHRRARSRSRSTGRTSSRGPACATGTRATSTATVYWLERVGLRRRRTPRTTDLEHNGARLPDHKAYISPAPRRVLVGRHAHGAEDGARRRRQPLLQRARTRSTGRSASRTARLGQPESRRGLSTSRPRAAARTRAASRPARGATRRARTSRRTR